MHTKTKFWLIVAASLIIIGAILFGGVMSVLKWDFTKLTTTRYETNEYAFDESFDNISIITDTADISFFPSETEKISVVCYEPENEKHLVAIEDGTLGIQLVDTRKWYEYIGISFKSPKIEVFLPRGEYGTVYVKSSTGKVEIPGDFKFESITVLGSTGSIKNNASAAKDITIKTSTGDILVDNITAEALDLSVSTGTVTAANVACEKNIAIHVSTGKTSLRDIRCKSVISTGNTGSIALQNVIAAEKFSIERSTGDVKFTDCDAAEIFVETDTGDVSGTLLSEKVFMTETDTGRINVPKTLTGGRCEICTDTGDIKIKVK